MSHNSVERMFALKKELASLEDDPAVQNLISKGASLRETVSDLGLSDREAAEVLAPQSLANPEKPLISLAGRARIPNSAGKKMLMQDDLLAVRGEIDRLLERLEGDPAIQQRIALIEAIEKLGIHQMDAAEFLSPGTFRRISTGGATQAKTRRGHRVRFWKNPHTGEVVKARATSNGTLRRWAEEHGKTILTDWIIPREEAPDTLNDD